MNQLFILKIILIITGSLIPISLAMFNGYMVKWSHCRETEKRNKLSKTWHFWIGILKGSWLMFLAGMLLLSGASIPWIGFISLLNILFIWPGFDETYNLINKKKFGYSGSHESGTGSRWDKILNKFDEIIKGILVLIMILWWPLKIHRFLEIFFDWVQVHWMDALIAIMIFTTAGLIARKFYNK